MSTLNTREQSVNMGSFRHSVAQVLIEKRASLLDEQQTANVNVSETNNDNM